MAASLLAFAAILTAQTAQNNAFRVIDVSATVKNRFEITMKTHRFLSDTPVAQEMNSQISQLEEKLTKEFKNGSIGAPISHPWELDIATQLFANRRNLISVLVHQFEYSGGAHPNQNFHCITVIKAGEKAFRLGSAPIVEDVSQRKSLETLLLEKLAAKDAAWVKEGSVKTITDAQLNNFVVRESGMTWYFDPYAMGPYVQGPFQIDCNWKELAPLLHRNLRPILMGGA